MSALLSACLFLTLACFTLALLLILLRLFRGPAAQDRVVALDALYLTSVPLVMALAIRYDSRMYFESALLIALSGFVGATVIAKFLLRGEVIE